MAGIGQQRRLSGRGFTLLEMTLMIGVGTVLVLGMSTAVQSQLKGAVDMRNYLIALELAKQQMAVMNNASHPGTGTTNPSSDAAFPDFGFTQVVTSVATSGSDNIREVRLDTTMNGIVLVRLYTYRTSTASFGDGT